MEMGSCRVEESMVRRRRGNGRVASVEVGNEAAAELVVGYQVFYTSQCIILINITV